MLKRVLIACSLFVIVGALIGSLGLWIFLSRWVPVKGKALLIQQLEAAAPIEVEIARMRYEFLGGFVLTDVQVAEREHGTAWLVAPVVRASIGWLGLLRQEPSFKIRALLTAPCEATLLLSGRYHLRRRTGMADIRSDEIPIHSFSAPLRRLLPQPLADGKLDVRLRARQDEPGPPVITGELIGTELTWQTPTWHAQGRVTVDGEARPPTPGGRWTLNARATLADAEVSELPVVGTISDLRGAAHLTDERIEIEQLSGSALGSAWKADGIILTGPRASVDAHLRGRADLARLASLVPQPDWRPEGPADLDAVCRGPLQPSLELDCLVRAQLRGVTLEGPKLLRPVTEISGDLHYDWLTHELSIDTLTGRLAGSPVHVSGQIATIAPHHMALHATGTLPLATIAPWLPAEPPLTQLGGLADLDVELRGQASGLRYTGEVELRDAAAHWVKPAMTLEELNGVIRLTPERMEIAHTTLRVNNQPMTITATASPSPLSGEAGPSRIIATVDAPPAQLELTGSLVPEEVVVEEALLSLGRSRLTLNGRVGRAADRASTLDLGGRVELAELRSIPFVTLSALEAWRLQGMTEVHLRFQGRVTDWPGAAVQGRLTADAITVRDVPIEQLVCVVEQSGRITRLRVPAALVAGGKLTGELAIDHHAGTHEYLLQADVIGLQLARLAEAIPAWRSRSITGTASTHATVSGVWERRATWRGDGWLNASGERLGDVPLLDKLFRTMTVGALLHVVDWLPDAVLGGQGEFKTVREDLESLRRIEIRSASLQWKLAQERLSTDDLRVAGVAGNEPVVFYARGGVGFDQTIDFVVEPVLDELGIPERPTDSTLAKTVLKAVGQLERLRGLIGRRRLTGTLKDPKLKFELAPLQQLITPSSDDALQGILNQLR